jgi:hypothetical protein
MTLAVHASGLILHVILSGLGNRLRRISPSLRICPGKTPNRTDIIRQIHVLPAAVQVSHIPRHHLGQLAIKTNRSLHIIGRMEMWIQRIAGGSSLRRVRGERGHGLIRIIESRIGERITLFIRHLARPQRHKIIMNPFPAVELLKTCRTVDWERISSS